MMGDFHADNIRDFAGRRDQRSAGERDAANDLPRVQSHQGEQDGSLPVGDVQAGWGGGALLALRMGFREVSR